MVTRTLWDVKVSYLRNEKGNNKAETLCGLVLCVCCETSWNYMSYPKQFQPLYRQKQCNESQWAGKDSHLLYTWDLVVRRHRWSHIPTASISLNSNAGTSNEIRQCQGCCPCPQTFSFHVILPFTGLKKVYFLKSWFSPWNSVKVSDCTVEAEYRRLAQTHSSVN